MSDIQLLAPPYRVVASSLGEVPPTNGAIAICWSDSSALLSGAFRSLLRDAPWCVPCLITTSAPSDPAVLAAVRDLPGQLTFTPDPLSDELLVERVKAAARSRPAPASPLLADYVSNRTGHTGLRLELTALLTVQAQPHSLAEPVVPSRTVRGRLSRFGPLTAHCWRAIGALSRVAAHMNGDRVEVLAWQVGVEARTLRRWTRRYLGATLQEYRERIGWEWVLESALRVAGYVKEPAATLHGRAARRRWGRPVLPVPQPLLSARPQVAAEFADLDRA